MKVSVSSMTIHTGDRFRVAKFSLGKTIFRLAIGDNEDPEMVIREEIKKANEALR